MTYELVIRGGTLVTPTGVLRGDLGIEQGVLRELADELPGGHEEIDARGLLVLPGAVDAHVHLNDPGRADWEGMATGSAALAAGGSTTAIDMPLNAHPPTVDAAAFDLKAAR
ncbi:MAG: allantoinase, partial [Gaiellales bacterium]|nr:allantoinase [Gaiellales bacterium]